jgi:hypothetical protein
VPDADAAVVVWDEVDEAVGDLPGRVVRTGIPDRPNAQEPRTAAAGGSAVIHHRLQTRQAWL